MPEPTPKKDLWEEIKNFFHYGPRENLREADKKLRDTYTQDLRNLRYRWESVLNAALDQGIKSLDLKKVIQILDRLMEKVEHADYGYAGLFDRKGKIREKELEDVLQYDRSLSGNLETIKREILGTNQDCEKADFSLLTERAKGIKGLLLDFEINWDDREKVFGRQETI
ncbi:MAG: hypothetical protein AB1393_10170 [Candidatus Edwardsbacteria bacterium]